jgi:hypothetical protein
VATPSVSARDHLLMKRIDRLQRLQLSSVCEVCSKPLHERMFWCTVPRKCVDASPLSALFEIVLILNRREIRGTQTGGLRTTPSAAYFIVQRAVWFIPHIMGFKPRTSEL